jgi:hypothetical protein
MGTRECYDRFDRLVIAGIFVSFLPIQSDLSDILGSVNQRYVVGVKSLLDHWEIAFVTEFRHPQELAKHHVDEILPVVTLETNNCS